MVSKSTQPENIVFRGKIVEVVQDAKREFARRSPGVGLLIIKGNQTLLTKEYREEIKSFDYRLPGGKVFDTLVNYNNFTKSGGDILSVALEAAKKEASDEVGIDPVEIKHIWTSVYGATIVWDLHYFVVSKFQKLRSQNLEAGEIINQLLSSLLWLFF